MTRTVRVWIAAATLAGASVGLVVALLQRPSVSRPIVLRTLPGADGVMTDSRCTHVRDGASFQQVLQIYGWPRHVSVSQRAHNGNGFSSQETDGWELDYPLVPSAGWTRFCAVIFVTKGGRVDHKWMDLP